MFNSLLQYINIIYKEKRSLIAHHLDRYLTICCHGNNVTFSLGFSGDSLLRVRRVFPYLHRSTSWCEQSSTFHQHMLGCVFCTDVAALHRLSTWEMIQISYMTHFIPIDKKIWILAYFFVCFCACLSVCLSVCLCIKYTNNKFISVSKGSSTCEARALNGDTNYNPT